MRPLPATAEELRGRRAARWIRESTTGQFDRYGPDAQREMQDRAMVRVGLIDTGLGWSVAESGSTVHQSSAMRAMLEAARAGAFDVLNVAYVARWQRNLRQTLNLLEDELHPAGVAVWFADEELLSSNERHWDQLVDEAKAADSWLRKHRRRVTEGLAAKLATKRDPGGRPPFGFRRNAAKLIEPDPVLLTTVRQVFQLSAGGSTDRDVSAQVGLPLFTVRGILTSPLYLGRLRDGGPANWPPVVDTRLASQAAENRAGRATNAGRPATPARAYALSMLRCAVCGSRLIGDTDYYRHRDVCADFAAATPDWPRGWHGRRDGKGYPRELYEAAIGQVLAEVSLGAETLTRVVGLTTTPPAIANRLALSRIERERDAALALYRRDRDSDALNRTMERLDADEDVARRPAAAAGVPAAVAVQYLGELATTWQRAQGGPGRRMLAEALFRRIEARGFREATLQLTENAIANGFAAVIPERLDLTVGNGRGERSQARDNQLILDIDGQRAFVTMGGRGLPPQVSRVA